MWLITHDSLEHGRSAGISSCDFVAEKRAQLTHRFRLLDDDRAVYFEGFSDDAESERAFAPLDDFGEGYSGCTTIEYFERGAWVCR